MCGVNPESIVTEIIVAALQNDKFFENMTADEKVKSVPSLYRELYHEIVEPGVHDEHGHHHEHSHHVHK